MRDTSVPLTVQYTSLTQYLAPMLAAEADESAGPCAVGGGDELPGVALDRRKRRGQQHLIWQLPVLLFARSHHLHGFEQEKDEDCSHRWIRHYASFFTVLHIKESVGSFLQGSLIIKGVLLNAAKLIVLSTEVFF